MRQEMWRTGLRRGDDEVTQRAYRASFSLVRY
jgi:hypothetical protein